jgi:hypothetical protein
MASLKGEALKRKLDDVEWEVEKQLDEALALVHVSPEGEYIEHGHHQPVGASADAKWVDWAKTPGFPWMDYGAAAEGGGDAWMDYGAAAEGGGDVSGGGGDGGGRGYWAGLEAAKYPVSWSKEKIRQHEFQISYGGWVSYEAEELSEDKWAEWVKWNNWHDENGHNWRFDKNDSGTDLDTGRWQYEHMWEAWQQFWMPEKKGSDSETARSSKDHYEVET